MGKCYFCLIVYGLTSIVASINIVHRAHIHRFYLLCCPWKMSEAMIKETPGTENPFYVPRKGIAGEINDMFSISHNTILDTIFKLIPIGYGFPYDDVKQRRPVLCFTIVTIVVFPQGKFGKSIP